MKTDNPYIIKAISYSKRQIKVMLFAIKNGIPHNDPRCNFLLEKLLVKEQMCVTKAGLKPSHISFVMLKKVRNVIYN